MTLGEPAPAWPRRRAAGADSARSVLFTVLGELVLPTGGEAWTSAFIDVFGRLGVEEKAARQALMRTAADPLGAQPAVGRGAHQGLPGRLLLHPEAAEHVDERGRPGFAAGRQDQLAEHGEQHAAGAVRARGMPSQQGRRLLAQAHVGHGKQNTTNS